MDRKYLEDYAQKELSEYDRLVVEKMVDGRFQFEHDRFPPDYRFVKIQKPVAFATSKASNLKNLWAELPFCGSLIISIPPISKDVFERTFCKISEIPKIVEFIKETGKLQISLGADARAYTALDYLDPFFIELNPPVLSSAPDFIFGNKKETLEAQNTFDTIGKVAYFDFLMEIANYQYGSNTFETMYKYDSNTYVTLKLGHYAVVEEIENIMIDDPQEAYLLLKIYRKFIVTPVRDLRSDLINYVLEEINTAENLPLVYRPPKLRFPCEIGKFLLRKLTYAPEGLDACKELMYHYDAYDLRKILESLNEAIATNHPDMINKSKEELSEILDNIWNDPEILRRVKGLKIAIPVSLAAIGSIAAGPVGAASGFLAGLGFDVAKTSIDIGAEGLSEKLAKLRAKSYQANIYDFKNKYKTRITLPKKEK